VLLAACTGLSSASQNTAKSWLGVMLGDAVDGGVQVVALVPEGPAERAGLERGDIILQANELPVGDRERLDRLLVGLEPGDAVTLGILRAGEPMELAVELGDWRLRVRQPIEPDSPKVLRILQDYRLRLALDQGHLGFEIAEVTPDLRDHYGAPGNAGVLVTRVEPEEHADQAGMMVGDILVRADGREVSSRDQLEEILLTWEGEQPLRIRVIRDREPLTLELTGGRPPGMEVMVVSTAVAVPPEIGPDGLASAEARLRAEIESLERKLQELHRLLEELESHPREEPED
jgi:S1-C subfamily serine protease